MTITPAMVNEVSIAAVDSTTLPSPASEATNSPTTIPITATPAVILIPLMIDGSAAGS